MKYEVRDVRGVRVADSTGALIALPFGPGETTDPVLVKRLRAHPAVLVLAEDPPVAPPPAPKPTRRRAEPPEAEEKPDDQDD